MTDDKHREALSEGELDRCERMLTACTCIDDYKILGRVDPECEACNLGAEVIDTFRALRRQYAAIRHMREQEDKE